MSKVICFENDLGYASLIHIPPEMFNPNSATRMELAALGIEFDNDDEVIAFVAAKDVPQGKDYSIVDSENLPTDKDYRNAWVINQDKSGVEVSLDKAKPLQLDRIRNMRTNVFDSADIDFNKSVEKVLDKLMALIPDDADVVALKDAIQKRNDLRDAPEIDLSDVQTVDDLKNKVPDVLKLNGENENVT